jgi:hypothetical protein
VSDKSFYVPPSAEMNSAMGRLAWSTLNLHHTLRYLFQYAADGDRDWPRLMLGQLIQQTRSVLPSERIAEYDEWVERYANGARIGRNAILHGIPGWHWENEDEPVVSTMTHQEVHDLAEQVELAHHELIPLVEKCAPPGTWVP